MMRQQAHMCQRQHSGMAAVARGVAAQVPLGGLTGGWFHHLTAACDQGGRRE